MATQKSLRGSRWLALITVLGALGCSSAQKTATATEGEAERAGADVAAASGEAGSVWNTAAERGVAFRAIGQEPGWVVEVFDGKSPRLEARLAYGERSVVIDSMTRTDDGFQGVASDGTAVRLRVTDEQCVDSMSGERFSQHATLEVGTDVFRGCGRTLSR